MRITITENHQGRIRLGMDLETFKGLHGMLETAEIADHPLDDDQQKLLQAVVNFKARSERSGDINRKETV